MNIETARKKHAELEEQIFKLLVDFQKDTGLRPVDLCLHWVDTSDALRRYQMLSSIELRVEL